MEVEARQDATGGRVELALSWSQMIDWIKKLLQGNPQSEVEGVDDDNVDPFEPFPEPVVVEITDVIDLHTIPARDVKRVVEEYLEQANLLGFLTVRIIHGKGVGVQREMVRSILGQTPFVADWADAPPEAGGRGATIVRLLTERPSA